MYLTMYYTEKIIYSKIIENDIVDKKFMYSPTCKIIENDIVDKKDFSTCILRCTILKIIIYFQCEIVEK